MKRLIQLTVNGEPYELAVEPWWTLLEVLRDELKLTGAKEGCGIGECGACTVIMNGKTVNSCIVLAVQANGKELMTIEGLAEGAKLHPIQEAFVNHGALQCGFCTPGLILTAVALLEENPNPTDEEIRFFLQGNLCRCTGYSTIVRAIKAAASVLTQK